MDLKSIKGVLDSNLENSTKERMIISILADDKKVIPMIMEILDSERMTKRKLITDLNVELSRAHLCVQRPKVVEASFVDGEIKKFYRANKHQIGHCLANMGIEEDV